MYPVSRKTLAFIFSTPRAVTKPSTLRPSGKLEMNRAWDGGESQQFTGEDRPGPPLPGPTLGNEIKDRNQSVIRMRTPFPVRHWASNGLTVIGHFFDGLFGLSDCRFRGCGVALDNGFLF
jgi:hypothetical protein